MRVLTQAGNDAAEEKTYDAFRGRYYIFKEIITYKLNGLP